MTDPQADPSPPPGESPPTPTPPWVKWQRGLDSLLDDETGSELFEEYLSQEGCAQQLNFFYACEGLKTTDQEDPKIPQIIRTIFRHFIQNHNLLGVRDETKKEIIRNKLTPNIFIFNQAQSEVKTHMNDHLYPNFLKSELYINTISNESFEETKKKEVAQEEDKSPEFFKPTFLENIPEEVVVSRFKSSKALLTKENLMMTEAARTRELQQLRRLKKTEASMAKIASPYHAHASYNSYNPVSRQDSEIQSLSSGAMTEDLEREKKKRHSRLKAICYDSKVNPNDNLAPITIHKMNSSTNNLSPQAFAKLLCDKLLELQQNLQKEAQLQSSNIHKPNVNPKEIAEALNKLQMSEEMTQPDDILDNHMSRVFTDVVPHIRSPRSPSNRLSKKIPLAFNKKKEKDQISHFSVDSGNFHDFKYKSLDRLERTEAVKVNGKKKWSQDPAMDSGVSVLSGATAPHHPFPDHSHDWRQKKPSQMPPPDDNARRKKFAIEVYVQYPGQDLPYNFKMHGPSKYLTLAQFKEQLPKRGNYRYFFKRDNSAIGSCTLSEIIEDFHVVPQDGGKIIATLENSTEKGEK